MKFDTLKAIVSGQNAYLLTHQFLRDGREIIIQEMVHIGRDSMYAKINSNILHYLKEHTNAKVFLEGVHGSKEERQKVDIKMMSIIGVKRPVNAEVAFLKTFYRSIAYVADLSVQDSENYLLNVPKNSQVKADISHTQMFELIKDLPDSNMQMDMKMNETKLSIAKKLRFPGWILRQALKAVLLNRNKLGQIKGTEGIQKLHHIILHERNMFLLDKLLRSRAKNIYVTYGAAHLPEIIEKLKEHGFSHRVSGKVVF